MTRFDVGRKSSPFKTFIDWLVEQDPGSERWLATVDALVISRNLLGDTVRLISPARRPANWPAIASVIATGFECQCGVRPFDVECSET